MRATKLHELEKLAAKLSAIARTLPPGEDRQNAYRDIAGFRDRIAALINSQEFVALSQERKIPKGSKERGLFAVERGTAKDSG
jgi:hypothetical protein